ncbi:MAG TPA: hypothetical protein VIK31_14150 [Propionibacteriaceae bacterium]
MPLFRTGVAICEPFRFVAAFQKPAGNPAAIMLTLVEPSRSAAAVRKDPPDALFKSCNERPRASRSVVLAPGLRRSSSGMLVAARAANS